MSGFGGLNSGTVVSGGNMSSSDKPSGSVTGGTLLGGVTGGTSSKGVTDGTSSGSVTGGTIVPGGTSQGGSKSDCADGYVNINNECVPIPYLEETPKFTLVCPAEYTLNTNPDKSVVCTRTNTFSNVNIETFSQNTNGKCKARY